MTYSPFPYYVNSTLNIKIKILRNFHPEETNSLHEMRGEIIHN